MKSRKIEVIIKTLIPVVIIAGCFGIEKVITMQSEKSFNHPIVVNDDEVSKAGYDGGLEIESKESYGDVQGLTANFGFINDNEVLLGIGMTIEEFFEKYPDEVDPEDEIMWEQEDDAFYGKMYVFNLNDETKKLINIDERDVYSDFVPGINKINYVSGEKYCIYDLNSDSMSAYKDISETKRINDPPYKLGEECKAIWSKDGNNMINFEDEQINIYNFKDHSSKSFSINQENRDMSIIPSYYSDDGQDIYFIGAKYKKSLVSQGIFKLNSNTGEVEEIFLLPYTDYGVEDYSKRSGISSNDYCVLDDGKRIIFNATIEGVDGTYIYDVENNKFYNVIPHTVKGEEGSHCSRIWVSPDKSKVVYMNLAEADGIKQWNLYAAKINGNSLTNRVCIYKNINLCGKNITWSTDSKKILFFTADETIIKYDFSFKDKNEMNIITFK